MNQNTPAPYETAISIETDWSRKLDEIISLKQSFVPNVQEIDSRTKEPSLSEYYSIIDKWCCMGLETVPCKHSEIVKLYRWLCIIDTDLLENYSAFHLARFQAINQAFHRPNPMWTVSVIDNRSEDLQTRMLIVKRLERSSIHIHVLYSFTLSSYLTGLLKGNNDVSFSTLMRVILDLHSHSSEALIHSCPRLAGRSSLTSDSQREDVAVSSRMPRIPIPREILSILPSSITSDRDMPVSSPNTVVEVESHSMRSISRGNPSSNLERMMSVQTFTRQSLEESGLIPPWMVGSLKTDGDFLHFIYMRPRDRRFI